MEKLEFPRVGEQMYHQVLDNGLHILPEMFPFSFASFAESHKVHPP